MRSCENAVVADEITRSLSLLWGLKLANYEIKDTLNVHVVGSTSCETGGRISQWELIPHLHPNIKKLRITFIGPEVLQPRTIDLCKSCRKIIEMNYSKQVYHDFVKSNKSEKADVVCAFNCGFYTYPSWMPSVRYMLKTDPFIITSFDNYEAEKDIKIVRDTKPSIVFERKRNPFAGLRPERGWYDELSYNNKFVTVFTNAKS